jgi:hypothetical protein
LSVGCSTVREELPTSANQAPVTNAQIHGPGKVNIACRVDNITSPSTRLNITWAAVAAVTAEAR